MPHDKEEEEINSFGANGNGVRRMTEGASVSPCVQIKVVVESTDRIPTSVINLPFLFYLATVSGSLCLKPLHSSIIGVRRSKLTQISLTTNICKGGGSCLLNIKICTPPPYNFTLVSSEQPAWDRCISPSLLKLVVGQPMA